MLAAVGTALPETMIPIIAIVFGGGGEATDDVGVGAILGDSCSESAVLDSIKSAVARSGGADAC